MALVILDISTADTTPDVVSLPDMVKVTYSSSLEITNFDNGVEGQELKIMFKNNNITVKNNSNIILSDGVDFVSENEYILQLISDGTKWYEKCRNIITYS